LGVRQRVRGSRPSHGQQEGLAVVNDSRSDNPDALSGVLTGTSFVGGLAATAAAALTTDLGRNENRAKSLYRFLFAAGGPVGIGNGNVAENRADADHITHHPMSFRAEARHFVESRP
jgi:hypothetical protein